MSIWWPIAGLTLLTLGVRAWAYWPAWMRRRQREIPSDTLRAMARAAQRERGEGYLRDVKDEMRHVPPALVARTRQRMGVPEP